MTPGPEAPLVNRRENQLKTLLIVGASEAVFGFVMAALPFILTFTEPIRTVLLVAGAFQILSGAAIIVFREQIVTFLQQKKGE